MKNIIFSLSVIMPMAFMIAVGYLLKKTGFISEAFLADAKKLCFYIFLPTSLFKSLYDSEIAELPVALILYSTIGLLVIFFLSVLISKLVLHNDPRIGVVADGMFRTNFSYIGIPLATQMFSDANLISKTMVDVSLLTLFVIPLCNILSTIVLSVFNKENSKNIKEVIYKVITNPCIIGVLIGGLVVLIRTLFNIEPFFIRDHISSLYKAINYTASIATPFSLLVVGASLNITHSIGNRAYLFLTVMFKNLIFPFLSLYIAYVMHIFDAPAFATLISFFASPTAVSTAIMASEMGADYDLANEIVVYSTLFSIFSLFTFIFGLKSVGCL